MIILSLEWRGQSRASPTSRRRCDVPCKRLIRDSAGLAAPAPANQTAREPSGDGSRSSQGHTAKRFSLGGGRGKRNGEVNSPTPGNRCVGGPSLFGVAGRLLLSINRSLQVKLSPKVSTKGATMRIASGAAALALALCAHISAAQQPGPPQPPDQRPGAMRAMPGMADQMRMMDSLNARLDTLVSRMNRATGNRKLTAMADVIKELVAQRKMMHEHMRQMMQMREGMMMQMRGQPAPAESARAPMPKADSATADTGHAAHHPPN